MCRLTQWQPDHYQVLTADDIRDELHPNATVQDLLPEDEFMFDDPYAVRLMAEEELSFERPVYMYGDYEGVWDE